MDRIVNAKIKLVDAFQFVQIGDRVLTNGDCLFTTDNWVLGTVVNKCKEKGEMLVMHIEREDGLAGGGEDEDGRPNNLYDIRAVHGKKSSSDIIILDENQAGVNESPAIGCLFFSINGPYVELCQVVQSAHNGRFSAIPYTSRMGSPLHAPVMESYECSPNIPFLQGVSIPSPCSICGKEATSYYRGSYFCNKHTLASVAECFDCHTAHPTIDLSTISGMDGTAGAVRHVCGHCYNERYSSARAGSEARVIHNYSYRPKPRFLEGDQEQKSKLFLGVELEVEVPLDESGEGRVTLSGRSRLNRMSSGIVEKFSNVAATPWFYLKSDSSLRNGFEIVTQPATLMRHIELPWKEMLGHLRKQKCKSDEVGTCGLHVHINKSYMSADEQIRLGYFVNSHKTKMEAIARRSSNQYSQFRTGEALHDSFIHKLNKGDDVDRYQAVNWKPMKTVEFRLFKGTLKYVDLIATLEFSHSLVNFVKTVTIGDIKDRRKAWVHYTNFLKNSSYKLLGDYLITRGVMKGDSE